MILNGLSETEFLAVEDTAIHDVGAADCISVVPLRRRRRFYILFRRRQLSSHELKVTKEQVGETVRDYCRRGTLLVIEPVNFALQLLHIQFVQFQLESLHH